MKTVEKGILASGKKGIVPALKYCWNVVKNLFEPEEVEVTFKEEGSKKKYTYRVIEHQTAA